MFKRKYKKVLFRIGVDAGFFSEFNNMIFSLHYCLKHDIIFVLNSNHANFSFKKGWSDYFVPFLKENQFLLNKYYNNRLAPPIIVRHRDKIGFSIYKIWLWLNGYSYTTWQILPLARKQSIDDMYSLPAIGIKGQLLQNCSKLVDNLWVFQPQVKELIDQQIHRIQIPECYIALHIRLGDKIAETGFQIELDKYMKVIEQNNNGCSNIFVATDDYTSIEMLQVTYPTYNFFTLCNETKRGYHQNYQSRKNKEQVKEDMIDLFADVELLCKGNIFVGTLSSNVGIFMLMRLGEERCYGVDYDKWKVW